MAGLAAFIMRGRWAAIAVLAVASAVPPLAWVGGGALALVTLRRGPAEGALAALAVAGVFAALALAAGQSVWTVLWPLLEFWLPLLAAAAWLRWTVSLSQALQLIGLLACLFVLGLHLWHGDPAAFWAEQMTRIGEQLGLSGRDAEAWGQVRDRLTPLMTGLWAVNVMAMVIISLILGRWWQAVLYNPGGFRDEFHGLRLGQQLTIASLVLLAAGLYFGPGLLNDLGFVLSSLFVVQTLAIVHAVAAMRSWNVIGLVALYVLLPFLFRLYAFVGMADTFVDIRRRLSGSERA